MPVGHQYGQQQREDYGSEDERGRSLARCRLSLRRAQNAERSQPRDHLQICLRSHLHEVATDAKMNSAARCVSSNRPPGSRRTL